MAGFGARYRLGEEPHHVVMYDKNPYAGGHTSSWTFPPGFTFDHGPHVSFTKHERIRELLAENVDQAFEEVQYRVNNYWHGHWIPHPVQVHLHGLPVGVITEVIEDFVRRPDEPTEPIANYEEWLRTAYGRAFSRQFPEVYTRKYHTTEAHNLTTDWIGPRMYRPTLEEVVRGAIEPDAPNVHYVTGFRYPTRGGFAHYLRRWVDEAKPVLGTAVVSIDPAARELRLDDGRVEPYDGLISSVPLPDLVPMVANVPPEVVEAASRLACTSCLLVNIGIDRPSISDAHISYFYDDDIVFTRLSFPSLMSPHNAPDGTSSVQAEIYYSRKYMPLEQEPEGLVEPVIRDLVRCGYLETPDEVVYRGVMTVDYANVIFDRDRAPALDIVHSYLDEVGIVRCGRYGDWGYIWTDEAFQSGERAAATMLSNLKAAPHLAAPRLD
jgi:protoporphyrinogen oxidase